MRVVIQLSSVLAVGGYLYPNVKSRLFESSNFQSIGCVKIPQIRKPEEIDIIFGLQRSSFLSFMVCYEDIVVKASQDQFSAYCLTRIFIVGTIMSLSSGQGESRKVYGGLQARALSVLYCDQILESFIMWRILLQYNDFPRMENSSRSSGCRYVSAIFVFFFLVFFFMLSIRRKQSYSMLKRGMESSL